jgi:hypothetical protein
MWWIDTGELLSIIKYIKCPDVMAFSADGSKLGATSPKYKVTKTWHLPTDELLKAEEGVPDKLGVKIYVSALKKYLAICEAG